MLLVGWVQGCLINTELYEERKDALTDHDGDGFIREDDCDDDEAAVYPGAVEVCDGLDNDCAGGADDGAATDAPTWYRDADDDGYGAGAGTAACEAPDGHVADASDCDDGDGSAHPGGQEVAYDGVDQDCSGADVTDVDGDGEAAEAAGGEDCDDDDASVYPGAEETWGDGFTDNDCDGDIEGIRLEYGSDAWIGESAGSQAGRRIGPLGDVDGDGLAEYLVGAVYESSTFSMGGAVYLVPGGVSSGSLADANVLLPGGQGWYLPSVVEGGPDVDADGTPDVLAVAPGYESFTGAAFLVSGSLFGQSSSLSLPEDAFAVIEGDEVGGLASGGTFLGDVWGDGLAYVAVSALYADVSGFADAGAIGVFEASSLDHATISEGSMWVAGPYDNSTIGNVVDRAGDIDGDGLDDYLVSVGYGDLAYVLPGGVAEPKLPDDALFRLSGTGAGEIGAVEMLGDVDGDGARDLSCITQDTTVLIFTVLLDDPVRLIDEESATIELGEGALGYDILDLGDLDEDGRDETYVPAQWYPPLETGLAGIFEGAEFGFRTTLVLDDAALTAVSVRSDARMGYRTALSEDVDGDGAMDILIAGYSDTEGGADAGAALTVPVPR